MVEAERVQAATSGYSLSFSSDASLLIVCFHVKDLGAIESLAFGILAEDKVLDRA